MAIFNKSKIRNRGLYCVAVLFAVGACLTGPAMAKDMDVYKVNTKQNCYILMDTSGSMAWPVYESTVDYGAMYDYLYGKTNIGDPAADDTYYNNHEERTKIFLVQGDVGLTVATVNVHTDNEKSVAFTGDAGSPGIDYSFDSLVDTHTLVDASGNLSGDGAGTQRITTDADGYVLFDGQRLPDSQDIKLHDLVTLSDGSQVDNGLGGLMHAPGFYFSGYEGVAEGSLDEAESGDENIYLFAVGNWVNMQTVLNLEYTSGSNDGKEAWKYERYPLSGTDEWTTQNHSLDYPEGDGNYAGSITDEQTIVHPGAVRMQVHFSSFDVNPQQETTVVSRWSRRTTSEGDSVSLSAADGTEVVRYDNNNAPAGGWSEIVNGDTIRLAFRSNGDDATGNGYTIDMIRFVYESEDGTDYYQMQSRLDVAKDAMIYVLDAFVGKINWGFAHFNSGNGATVEHLIDPEETDEDNRTNVKEKVEAATARGGTPLGEALQDVWKKGYYDERDSLNDVDCRKNYIISMTDGYPNPTSDTDWKRIDGVIFSDADGDGWTADPVQSDDPPANYYDDVAEWIYKHSWKDTKDEATGYLEVAEPADSYDNVITHHIAFGARQPLLEDAAGQSGGIYTAAFNKAQLVSAFYALVQETQAVSFIAPVVSVDAANKIQNGDDLYLGFFLPQASQGWVGNLKKFKLGDGAGAWLYDGGNNEAINGAGYFLDNRTAFWADDDDKNDSDNYGGHDVKEDGAGEVLTEQVKKAFDEGMFYERPIYTYINSALQKVAPGNTNITTTHLDVADVQTRNQVINYVHGYTYEADAARSYAPVDVRDWALGGIVHSSPVVVDYYNTADFSKIDYRYIIVGANDGMLHVFDDTDNDSYQGKGKEVFAFIPPDLLPKLKLLPTEPVVDMADGEITLYRRDKKPKYLIFGLRRGGRSYWCLDISNPDPLKWTVKWKYSPDEMGQSWAKPQVASIPYAVDPITGKITFKDIVVFTGGYDVEEDNFPEPFFDQDGSGSPFTTSDAIDIDPAEWSASRSDQDYYDNDTYDRYNPDKNESGRGIFAVDIDDPTAETYSKGDLVLPFSVTYGDADDTSGNVRTLTSMKFCFPATPTMVSGGYTYVYGTGDAMDEDSKNNVLNALYATDIYANIYKLTYRFEINHTAGSYQVADSGWTITKIFSANKEGPDSADQGRKAFYSPAVSWGGACNYFDAGNYGFPGVTFSGQYDIASLFFGTGDREHPTYAMTRNRLYAIYDDSSVTAVDSDKRPVTVSTMPYTEDNLLNLSCDELGEDTTFTGMEKSEIEKKKADLKKELTDDAVRNTSTNPTIENGNEDDAKGWYIILEDQGDPTKCGHCEYAGAIKADNTADRDNHKNEKILSKVALYCGALYFTSYQPSMADECNPQGNGFAYSVNYCDATAAYNNNEDNDSGDHEKRDVTDRYQKINDVRGIPSEFAIVVRDGGAGAYAMMGEKIIGPGKGFGIKSPGMGLELYYWRQGNSQKPKKQDK